MLISALYIMKKLKTTLIFININYVHYLVEYYATIKKNGKFIS